MTDLIHSSTEFALADPEAFIAFCLSEFESHGFEFTRPKDSQLEVAFGPTSVLFERREKTGFVRISSNDFNLVLGIRESISLHLAQFDPALKDVCWSGMNMRGELPPNFKLAKVVSCAPFGNIFLRMVVEGDDIGRFNQEGLHFRVVRQKNPERAPVWPVMSERGTPDWPDGEDELWDKVYTTRYFDTEKNQMTFDIFRHEGGFTSEWAEAMPIGQEIGLMGPGGGWFPEGDSIFIAGDETAIPAIARILEEMPRETTGAAIILTDSANDVQNIDTPDGIDIKWIFRNEGHNLTEQSKAKLQEIGKQTTHWFAASKAEAREMRGFFTNEMKLQRSDFMSVGYWS